MMKDLYGYKRYRKQLLRGLRRYNRFSRFCRIAEKLSRESFKNTRRYMRFFSTLSLLFVISFLATRDWYHGWYGILCTFFDVSVFDGMQFDWSLICEFGKLFFQLGMLIAFVFAFINIFKRCQAKHYERRYYAQAATCMENQHSVCFTGPPGSGKSSSGGDWAVNVAMRRWEDLKYEYHTKKRQLRNYARLGQTEELEKFKALEEAYTFFKSRERWYVPCLATTFGMRVGGRYTYKANNSFFTQQQRIPEYCVIFDDEAGGSKGADTSSKVADNVADFYRYVRHYGDFILIMTEQGDDGTGKYIRKCLDDTIYCKSQKWVVRPGFLLRRWQKMRSKLIRREEKGKYRPRYNAFVYYFGRIVRTIGYRRIDFRSMGNIEHSDGGDIAGREGIILLPSRLVYDYDDRAYRFTYKAKDFPLELDGWDRLTLRPEDDIRNVSVVRKSGENQKGA